MAELPKARRQGTPYGRTSMPESPANDLFAIHPASSGKCSHQPCLPFHERKLGDQTKDDVDKELREETVLWAFSNVVVQRATTAFEP
jgi:hypothetical protein